MLANTSLLFLAQNLQAAQLLGGWCLMGRRAVILLLALEIVSKIISRLGFFKVLGVEII